MYLMVKVQSFKINTNSDSDDVLVSIQECVGYTMFWAYDAGIVIMRIFIVIF